ncbi:uncharacterized protein ACNS7B_021520 [Menidia menidia]
MKFQQSLIVQKGTIFYLLSVVGGLLVTLTAGGPCVDVVVRTAQSPDNLLRLSKALIGLMGLKCQNRAAGPLVKSRLRKLCFTDSFCSLLDMTRSSMPGSWVFVVLWDFPISTEGQTNLKSTATHWIAPKRCRIIFILLCGESSQLILCVRSGSRLRSYDSTNKLLNFVRGARAQGDVVYLLVGEHVGQNGAGCETMAATRESYPTGSALLLSALSAALLWMFLPHMALCAGLCLGWNILKRMH